MLPEELEEVGAWLTKAAHDLQAASYLSKVEEPLLDIVVYHCQQAMEKAVKEYLTFKNSPFAKVHNLVPLVEQAADLDPGFEDLRDHAECLSPFAWRFRYPGDLLDPGADEARNALVLAREALDFVLDRIPDGRSLSNFPKELLAFDPHLRTIVDLRFAEDDDCILDG